jgi:hypothetical protein
MSSGIFRWISLVDGGRARKPEAVCFWNERWKTLHVVLIVYEVNAEILRCVSQAFRLEANAKEKASAHFAQNEWWLIGTIGGG